MKALEEAIRKARETGRPIPGGRDWGVGLEEAYRVQEALNPGPLLGYKLGLVSEAKQRQMGISEPILGRVRPEMLLGEVNLGRFLQPRAEPELALVLREDLPPGSGPERAWAAIGGFFLALDILDSVWEGYRFTAVEVVADNASGGGFLLGLKRWAHPPKGELVLYLNGERLTQGPIEALGDPGARLAWLAKRVGGLSAGQVVFLGSPAPAVPLAPGVLEVWGEGGILFARVE
ncbi:2-keto-4-pentenoate hydratase [Thermus scotoductus]|uniref:4-oxalocrotonate decarboxylase n=1 Tax=Thermus scotoductus TaxID=37636 RepID=A0A430VU04_THESC|nr:fumarylacetoacetate hydrolase family protein [Thermus scotoductus]RTG97531.1 4-oxalocrotonate decarboxylase [Thermus scotoductus]RTH05984.1 4-oxalocrotonate decarboxylase [Thermus scotoductus]RTH16879.1 4-oxalocrotonate decarboxylase [Thermus scotoductus]RTI02053.1 4-oxalocrotonate decarboxylase [Thermus scotoductus]RTI24382.1 4-oxalocrotonate decarboxylase [Thermus scotoductus]